MLKLNFRQATDKDLSFSSQLDHDFFEQYLDHDSSSFSDGADGANGFRAFDITFDEDTASSESHSAESRSSDPSSLQSPPQAGFSFTKLQQCLPSRTHPVLVRCGAPRSEISGSELLSLEGKSPHVARHTRAPSSSSSSSNAPPLRRKAKFESQAPESDHRRSQRVSKIQSNEMIRPSYYHRHETPSNHEWTQRFEQISLQPTMSHTQLSPSQEVSATQNARPGDIFAPNQMSTPARPIPGRPSVHRSVTSSEIPTSHAQKVNSMQATAALPGLQHNEPSRSESYKSDSFSDGDARDGDGRLSSAGICLRQLQHPPIWSDAPAAPVIHDSTVSPSHIYPSWLHNLPEYTESFYENPTAPRSAPAFEHPVPHNIMIQPLDYDHFITEDPFNAYTVTPVSQAIPFESIETGDYPPHFYSTENNNLMGPARPQTPPPRSFSVSPPLPPTPSKSRQILKSRRKKSVSTLGLQKSTGAIKPHKSTGTLKSPKSAKGLKSSISTGQFGFVNFTPNDSNRILTGVAPSGSSKTKLRREQEASEKKRRLSQAALKAIEEAGGDVQKLEKLKAEFEN